MIATRINAIAARKDKPVVPKPGRKPFAKLYLLVSSHDVSDTPSVTFYESSSSILQKGVRINIKNNDYVILR